MFGLEFSRKVNDRSLRRQTGERPDQLGSDDGDFCTRAQKQIDLAGRNLPAADDHDGFVCEFQEDREVVHGASGRSSGR